MGEGGEIFVLDMGEPVKIAELAQTHDPAVGRGRGPHPHRIHRPAPRREALRGTARRRRIDLPTPHPKLRVAKARAADAGWYAECLAWLAHPETCDEATVKRQLKAWVPEYQPE
jgi:hypothetical protein